MIILIIEEAGWTPDQWGHSRFGTLTASTENAKKHLTNFMRALLKVSFLALLSQVVQICFSLREKLACLSLLR